MSRSARWLRRFASLSLAAALAGTQGCVTAALWRPHFELIESVVETQDVELARAPDGMPGVLLAGRDAEPTWWLRPERDADVALLLLEDAGLLQGAGATVTAVCDRREHGADDVIEFVEAKLELRAQVPAQALGEVVELDALDPAAQRVLRETRSNAFVYAGDPWLYLPSVMRRCMDRLSSPLLANAFADPGEPLRIESFVFVGADGKPRFEPGMPVPPAAVDNDLPLAQRCELLRSVSLLVRTTRGRRQQIVRLRPDRVWLWTGCEVDGSNVRHVSRWQWERAPATIEPSVEVQPLACRFTRTVNRYRLTAWDGSAWFKVLLTPVTVAVDAVLALPALVFAAWLGGADDVDVPREQRGR